MPRKNPISTTNLDTPQEEDEKWMSLALDLARRGLGRTIPNPAVGAVLVRGNKMIGSGWHAKAGEPHAEINALRSLANGEQAQGATLYVTLEPCSTHGRTPPCCTAIAEAGVSRVVWGATDPNPAHQGRAQDLLRTRGISVTTGVLQEECASLNREWNYFIKTGLPWVILKAGMSLDGRITASTTTWITSPAARRDGWKLRHQVDAILIGAETARRDNPRLTPRGTPPPHSRAVAPYRVVWSPSGKKLPIHLHLFSDAARERTLLLREKCFTAVLRHLARLGCVSVLLEGGGQVHGAAVDAGLVQEVVLYLAPKMLGGPVPTVRGLGAANNDEGLSLTILSCQQIGPDLRLHALVNEK